MTSNSENQITRSDLIKSAVNTGALGMEFSWTYYKQMNIAFCLMVANMLKKIYAGRPDDYAEALHRHSAFFNITPQLAPFVGGIAMAMEEKVARGEVEPESVNDIKAALMGPLSGLGDYFFLSTLRVVAAAVGISLCQAGNVFGPIAFLLVYNIPAFLIRIFGAIKGYELGIGFLDEAQKTGLMQKIMACVGIVGVMVVGAMSKDMFWASLPIAIGQGDSAQTLQDILDGIMPGMLAALQEDQPDGPDPLHHGRGHHRRLLWRACLICSNRASIASNGCVDLWGACRICGGPLFFKTPYERGGLWSYPSFRS